MDSVSGRGRRGRMDPIIAVGGETDIGRPVTRE